MRFEKKNLLMVMEKKMIINKWVQCSCHQHHKNAFYEVKKYVFNVCWLKCANKCVFMRCWPVISAFLRNLLNIFHFLWRSLLKFSMFNVEISIKCENSLLKWVLGCMHQCFSCEVGYYKENVWLYMFLNVFFSKLTF